MSIEITSINPVTQNAGTQNANNAASTAESDFSGVLKNKQETNLDAIFEAASKKYNVPVTLLKAVAKAESSFRPDATSKSGAMGIMQLMPGTAKSLGVTDAYDPEQNIMGGAKYLSQQLTAFGGDVSLTLAAYNAGPGAVRKYDGIPPYKETQNYVKKVTEYMGGGAIYAGSVTYTGKSASSVSRVRAPGNDSTSSGGSTSAMDGMAELFMMKMIELQMKSSEDDEDKKVF